jgi:glycine C-acetyltransferase
MLGDAKIASEMAKRLLNEGLYVISFSYPVVPKDQARIRTQMSAGHDTSHLDQAIKAFEKIGKELKFI